MEIENLRIFVNLYSAQLALRFAVHQADFRLWNNANETDMAAKLTNSNQGETAAV